MLIFFNKSWFYRILSWNLIAKKHQHMPKNRQSNKRQKIRVKVAPKRVQKRKWVWREFYSDKKSRFLFKPLNFVLLTADFLKTEENISWVMSFHSCFVKFLISEFGLNFSSKVGAENLFHGQTSWQMSQPNIQSSILSLKKSGIWSFNSIVA